MILDLETAQDIIAHALRWRKDRKMKPLTVAVLDSGGFLITLAREDGTSNMRPQIAQGKASGAIGMGLGSRALFVRAETQPYFIQAMNSIASGALVPVPGGVLIKRDGVLIGAVGITGDTSDNDEACAIAAIEAVGFEPDGG